MATETRMTLSDAAANPERCSDEQLQALHGHMVKQVVKATADRDAATKSRPSYAPKGKPTAREMGTAALLRQTQMTLDRVAAEVTRRGL